MSFRPVGPRGGARIRPGTRRPGVRLMTAFGGVRVLDFSRHFAAAMAAMHLGDLGAEVVKIDPTPEERGPAEPGYLAWNRNKAGIVLDLRRAGDLAEAARLVAGAD